MTPKEWGELRLAHKKAKHEYAMHSICLKNEKKLIEQNTERLKAYVEEGKEKIEFFKRKKKEAMQKLKEIEKEIESK